MPPAARAGGACVKVLADKVLRGQRAALAQVRPAQLSNMLENRSPSPTPGTRVPQMHSFGPRTDRSLPSCWCRQAITLVESTREEDRDRSAVRHCLCLVLSLLSWLIRCLCLVFPFVPSWLR